MVSVVNRLLVRLTHYFGHENATVELGWANLNCVIECQIETLMEHRLIEFLDHGILLRRFAPV